MLALHAQCVSGENEVLGAMKWHWDFGPETTLHALVAVHEFNVKACDPQCAQVCQRCSQDRRSVQPCGKPICVQ